MKSDSADPTSEVGTQKKYTVSDVIECLGLTSHNRCAVLVCWWIWFVSGWATTLVTFLLDAAAQEKSAWIGITSGTERLTIHDRSVALLGAGVVSAVFNPLLGHCGDAVGRISVAQGSLIICACVTLGYALASGKVMLVMLVLAAQMDGSALVAQSLLAEWVPSHLRGFLVVAMSGIWNIGRLAITLLWAYLPPSEHWMPFFLTSAIAPVILGIFLGVRGQAYESPRWLAVTGNMERCIAILRMAADTAEAESKPLPQGWDEAGRLQLEGDAGRAVAAEQRSTWAQLAELREPKLQRLVVIISFCYFCVSFAWSALFYWIMEYLMVVGAEAAIVPVMIAAPVGKVVSVVWMLTPFKPGQCFIDTSPRAFLMKVGYFGTAIGAILLCTTTNVIALAAIMGLTQVFEGFIWAVTSIYATEAFPTTVRMSATGVTWMLGTIGGITSAAVTGELMEIWVYLPMVTSAALLFAGGCACFLLTEERGESPLVDTMGYGSCEEKPV